MRAVSRARTVSDAWLRYSLEEHRHRFSVWAAGRAASVAGVRFSVESAAQVIAKAGLARFLADPDLLPDASNIDAWHREHRKKVIIAAKRSQLSLTHGVAAKLINIYFKTGLMGVSEIAGDRLAVFHPPVDRLLLWELARNNVAGQECFWRRMAEKGWSRFDSRAYESVIDMIRKAVSTRPMWMIESYWRGHQ